jgi:alpha-L-rhamnosidase
MASVPSYQMLDVPQTRWNLGFAHIALELCPRLQTWQRIPQRLVSFINDDSCFFGLKPSVSSNPITDLPKLSWGRSDDFILDFGLHVVGSVSFRLVAQGLDVDAPCRLLLTFGESPYDATEDLGSVKTWISTSWLPDEVINMTVFLQTSPCLVDTPSVTCEYKSLTHRRSLEFVSRTFHVTL